ncbi:hypothetical protein [Bacteroides pyogenes]|uniref:hypothetical protein n=1 Tax=Bacteroides pyogenes TaxID=310300 RepID=UPI001BAB0815|nr:hypothetical protein [Bacteroides pyogenes]MBR8725434.1 hypothetical protein [Bacteroides pyogenes]MBR8740052.1 hypothetical protein [Bacteroides pyogenes]MBR8755807.1 hypothetical protein [Bacteroides pyogenes]MBR8796018.1 hypothetical protein [Bacteroides pyogenes]MBR8810731.1 hypothetical protein [Bacteroides pyogenes]
MDGFIKLNRKFFSNDLWNEARTFSVCEAWLDLIQSARFDATPRKVSIGGREVICARGQYPASIRHLAKRWKWTERRVRTFLSHLKKEEMITIQVEQGISLITLCKYDEYNSSDTANDTVSDTANDTVNSLTISQLQPEVTQRVTQPLTQQVTQPIATADEVPGEAAISAASDTTNALTINQLQQQVTQGTGSGTDNTLKNNDLEDEVTQIQRKILYNILDNNKKKETTPKGVAKKENLSLSRKVERVDYNGLMEYYNETFKGKLSQIASMSENRKKAVRARIAEYGKESIRTVFQNVLNSPFLLGHNDRNWKADFDWIFKPAKFTRILEGNYNGKRTDTAATRRESVSRLKNIAGAILQGSQSKDV